MELCCTALWDARIVLGNSIHCVHFLHTQLCFHQEIPLVKQPHKMESEARTGLLQTDDFLLMLIRELWLDSATRVVCNHTSNAVWILRICASFISATRF